MNNTTTSQKQREPQIHADGRRLNEITERVIGCAYKVSNTLGCGFLEEVYENALKVELTKEGLSVSQQHPVRVSYEGETVGEYFADLLVEGSLVVELKSAKEFDDIHMAQCLNYLKATGLKVGILVNFGSPKVQIKRIVNDFRPGRIICVYPRASAVLYFFVGCGHVAP